MRRIDKIIRVEEHAHSHRKMKNKYYRTYAICGGDECVGYSDSKDDFKVGQEVECFFHDRWNVAKFSLPKGKKDGKKT